MQLPPILQIPGMKVIGIGEDERGAYLKFAVNKDNVREVTMYMLADGPVKWHYIYSMWDEATRTVVGYEGDFGDPAKDAPTNMTGR